MFLTTLSAGAHDLAAMFALPHHRLFAAFWLSSLVIAVYWAARQWQQRKAHLRQLSSLSYWWNASTRQDYGVALLNGLIFALSGSLTIILSLHVAHTGFDVLQFLLPHARDSMSLNLPVIATYSLLLWLLDDLSRYGLHRALHSRWLWRIHALHHSATVLTPISLLRVHPLEKALYQLRSSLVHGTMLGGIFYLTNEQSTGWQILGVNASVCLFNLLGANLRHSSIPIGYGRWERWFISPKQHQLHHATAHNRSNFGSILSIWDRLFGSWLASEMTNHIELPSQAQPLWSQLLLQKSRTQTTRSME